MKDLVKFEGYMIQKFLLEKKSDIANVEKDIFKLKRGIMGNNQKDKKNSYCVSLTIEMYTNKSKIELTINGYFEVSKEINEKVKTDFLNISAPAILYPYARTFISNVTAFDIDETVVLPIINFANLEMQSED